MKNEDKIRRIDITPSGHRYEKVDMKVWKDGENLRAYPKTMLLSVYGYDNNLMVLLIRTIINTFPDNELKSKYETIDKEYFDAKKEK